jgi:hypothetical protein
MIFFLNIIIVACLNKNNKESQTENLGFFVKKKNRKQMKNTVVKNKHTINSTGFPCYLQ